MIVATKDNTIRLRPPLSSLEIDEAINIIKSSMDSFKRQLYER